MDCCSVNGLDKIFNKSTARRELKKYLKKGLDKRARVLVECLKSQDIAGATILEVGGGIGSLHMELIKAGAARAVGYDAAPAYVEAAISLAERLGLKDSVEYHVGDFAEEAANAEDADVVLLDRVICCYPDMKALVTSSTQRTKRLCALTYPRRTLMTRALVSMLNFGLAIFRNQYRTFVHHPQEVSAILESQGLTKVFHTGAGFWGIWEVVVYRRQEGNLSTA